MNDTNAEPWLPDLFRAAGLTEDAPLSEIHEKMNALADAAAPVARGWWKWIILVQGLSVAAPLLWAVRRPLGLTPAVAASASLLSAALLVAVLWWIRWRGMHRTWARARLVAEVARGQLAANHCPARLTPHVLDSVPALQPLFGQREQKQESLWPGWRDAWIKERVDEQLVYYRSAKEKAERQRRSLTRWLTLLMDVMLALAVTGLVIALSQRGPQWLRMLGGYWLEIAIGLGGSLLAVSLILLQALRSMQELNRRTARFARQEQMLEEARRRLLLAEDPDTALPIVEATEGRLLDEVLDWYFEAETAEQFFR
ncbi:MAG: hypothetical protein EOP84_32060, partial [Verrucomicrobiaceae bacterium]